MKYKIPDFILQNADSLKSVFVNVEYQNAKTKVIKLHKFEEVDGVFIPSKFLINSTIVTFSINFKNGQTVIIESEEYEPLTQKKQTLTSKIYKSNYQDTEEDKDLILGLLNPIIDQTNLLNNNPIGTKNLIYYSCFKENEYLDLLVLSVKSILARGSSNADFLIITQPDFEATIKDQLKNFNINLFFHLIDKPANGVLASTYKLNIFDFERINDYRAILFLDCDIIACRNPDEIFNYINEVDCISTAFNPSIDVNSHKGKFHSLDYLKDPILNSINNESFVPFNAGQFLIKNSIKNQTHFENMVWFLQNWPGKVFFEQSIMNRYLLQAGGVDQKLSEYVYLNTFSNNLSLEKFNNLDEKVKLIHFASETLNGQNKLNNINKFKTETRL